TGTPLFLLDRSVPARWRDRLLARTAPSALLTTDADGRPAEPWPALLAGRARRAGPRVPDGTGYPLATSGSTGAPKVVLVGRSAPSSGGARASRTGRACSARTASPRPP